MGLMGLLCLIALVLTAPALINYLYFNCSR